MQVIQKKKAAFHKKIAYQFKANFKKKIRQSFFNLDKNQNIIQNSLSFRSETLQNFNQDSDDLTMYFQQIFDILKEMNAQQISDQQTDDLAHDLIYLILQRNFVCPHNLKLKKNQNQSSALVVALLSAQIDKQQLRYWFEYMNEQFRNIVYMNIEPQSQSSRMWIQDDFFIEQLLLDWSLQEVSRLVLLFLQESIYLNENFIHKVTHKVLKRVKHIIQIDSLSFIAQQMQILLYLTRLFRKNGSNGIKVFQLYINQLIQRMKQQQIQNIFSQATINQLQKYFQQLYQAMEIKITQSNFQKLIQVLCMNLKKVEYGIVGNKFSEKILIYNSKMLMNICLNYLRVNTCMKTGYILPKAILQKLDPINLKKELTEEDLETEFQKIQKLFEKVASLSLWKRQSSKNEL